MDVVASLPADAQAAESVQPGDGALDDPAEDARPRAVWLPALGDHGPDTALPRQPPLLVVVVATVREEHVRPSAGPSDDTGHCGDLVRQRYQPGDVARGFRRSVTPLAGRPGRQ